MKMGSNKAFHHYGAQGAPSVSPDVGAANMNKFIKGFLLGSAITLIITSVITYRYGEWGKKVGRLNGIKEGNIAVIDALSRHFPQHTFVDGEPPQIFGLKQFGIWVVESNGVTTLEIRNGE